MCNDRTAEFKAAMEKFIEADRQERVDARIYKPMIAIKEYAAGTFFHIDNEREWPLRYIESIEVSETGREPRWNNTMGVSLPHEARRAYIDVVMHSGNRHTIECNRHQVDPLLDVMRTAWKTKKSTK